LPRLAGALADLVEPGGILICTCHSQDMTPETLKKIFCGAGFDGSTGHCEQGELCLMDASGRALQSGIFFRRIAPVGNSMESKSRLHRLGTTDGAGEQGPE
jgi:hypothetical protein